MTPAAAARAPAGRWRRRPRWAGGRPAGRQAVQRPSGPRRRRGAVRELDQVASGCPARDQASRAPWSRSRTWPIRRAADERDPWWPRSSRWPTAGPPPSTSSTATEQTLVVRRPVDDHHGRAAAGDRAATGLGVDRSDQDALHPLLLREVEVRLLAGPRGCRCCRGTATARPPRPRYSMPFGDVGEERVAGVEHEVGQGAGCEPVRSCAGRLVPDEAEGAHGRLDPFPGRRGDPVGPVPDVRNGAQGHAGPRPRRP